MRKLIINLISVDEEGRLCVFPNQADQLYEFIYRAGNGTYWDSARGCFYPNQQKVSGHLETFERIYKAAIAELGISLALTSKTQWIGLSSKDQLQITKWVDAHAD